MEDYLKFTKEQMSHLDTFHIINIVIGNEACDLDSSTSALSYAYYLHKTSSGPGILHIPVLNIPSADYPLRTEITYYLGSLGLSQSLLTFRDQVDLPALHKAGTLQLILVDHNVLPSSDKELEDAVVEVVDHRVKEREDSDRVRLTIERVGSCSTLVAEKLLGDPQFSLPQNVARMLIGSIVIDTGNFSEILNLATSKDETVIGKLEDIVGEINRHDIYEKLKEAKSNLAGLTTLEILRKDLKSVTSDSLNIAISSIAGSLQGLLERDDLISSLQQFSHDRKAPVVLLMFLSVSTTNEPTRQLAVYSDNQEYRDQIVDVLTSSQEPSLNLSSLPSPGSPSLLMFSQENVQASRKKILPLIKSFISSKDKIPKTPDSGFAFDSLLEASSDNLTDSEQPSCSHNLFSPTLDLDSLSPAPADQTDSSDSNVRNLDFDPFSISSQNDVSNVSENPDIKTGTLLDLEGFGVSGFYSSQSPMTEENQQSGSASHAGPSLTLSNPDNPSNPDLNLLDLDPFAAVSQRSNDGSGNFHAFDGVDLFAGQTGVLMEASPIQGSTPEVLTPDLGATPERLVSYPSTPPNSYIEPTMDNGINKHDLPSFNSSEMLRRIADKKAELEAAKDPNSLDVESRGYPFTPQNSATDSPDDGISKEQDLPSFHSSEMVRKIEAKRTDLAGFTSPELDDVKKYPFTPPNSYADLSLLDTHTELHLFSEQVAQKVNKHRESLKEEDEEDIEAEDYPNMMEFPSSQVGNVVANEIAQNMKNLEVKNNVDESMGDAGDTLAMKPDHMEASGTSEPSGSPKFYSEGTEKEVAYQLAQDIIQKALDAYDSSLAVDELNEENRTSSIDTDVTEVSAIPEDSEGSESSSDNLHVETDYLSSVDPLKGNLDLVASPEASTIIIQTDAEKVVAEGQSFNQLQAEQAGVTPSDSDPQLVDDVEDELGALPDQNSVEITEQALNCNPDDNLHENGANSLPERVFSIDSGAVASIVGSVLNSDEDKETFVNENLDVADSVQNNVDPQDILVEGDTEEVDPIIEAKRGSVARSLVDSAISAAVEIYKNDGAKSLLEELAEVNEENLSEEDKEEVQEDEQFKEDEEKIQTELASAGPLGDSIAMFLKRQSHNKEDEGSTEEESSPSEVTSPLEEKDVEPSLTEPTARELKMASEIVKEATSSALALLEGECASRTEAHGGSSEEVSSPESVREVVCMKPPRKPARLQYQESVPSVTVTSPSEPAPLSDEEYIVTPVPAYTEPQKELVDEKSQDLDDDELKSKLDQLPKQMESGSTSSAPPEEEEEEEDNRKSAARPTSLESTPKRKIIPNMELLKDESLSTSEDPSTSVVSQSSSDILLSIDDVKTPDDLNTPEALNDSVFDGELDWESEMSASSPCDPIPVYSAREEFEDERSWRTVTIGDKQFRMDLKVIEPYKKVLSHGGYYGDGFNAIIVFAACYLPDKRRRDYHYVMDNLFMYVISTLELLVVEDYMIVYFHGATPKHKMPSMRWLKRCYEMIDRRLKKNLKSLLIVHPTLWLKTIVLMSKLFISTKFYNKLKYVRSLQELTSMVPTEYIFIPDEIKLFDAQRNKSSSSSNPTTPT